MQLTGKLLQQPPRLLLRPRSVLLPPRQRIRLPGIIPADQLEESPEKTTAVYSPLYLPYSLSLSAPPPHAHLSTPLLQHCRQAGPESALSQLLSSANWLCPEGALKRSEALQMRSINSEA